MIAWLHRMVLSVAGTFFLADFGGAQAQSTQPALDRELQEKTVLNDDLWPSPRAEGLGGALTGAAEGYDAPYFNPAGIGGKFYGKKPPKVWIRRLNFPLVAASFNQNVQNFEKDLTAEGGQRDQSLAAMLFEANRGQRQYARGSISLNLTVKRLLLVTFTDTQIAAVPSEPESGLTTLNYRRQTGAGLGLSLSDAKEQLYLGVFGYYAVREELLTQLESAAIIDPETRLDAVEEVSVYRGMGLNVGLLWKVSPRLKPTIALALRDVGATRFQGEPPQGGRPPEVKEDLSLAFSLNPELNGFGRLHFTLEVSRLSQSSVRLRKKIKTALEWQSGGFGEPSMFALRLGGNDAGVSTGAALHLGLLNVEWANYGVDIGLGNFRRVERRSTVIVAIDVAEL